MFHVYRNTRVSLTEQIVREISDRIETGILAPDSLLPSVRALSKKLEVSLVTVVDAYRILEQHKLIRRQQGKGTFVQSSVPSTFASLSHVQDFDWQLSVADYLPRAAVFRQHSGSATNVPYRMSIAALSPSLAQRVWTNDTSDVLQRAALTISEYGPVEGLASLRMAIGAYLHRDHLIVSPEDLFVTSGAQQAIEIIAQTFLGPGDTVAVEAPTYPGALDVFRARGVTIIPVPMDDEGMRVDVLMRQADQSPPKLIYTMPTYQNPTGLVMSRKRRLELLDFAESYGTIITEDDSFSDCLFEEVPPTIKSMDRMGHVAYIRGFSKTFSPGCRIAAVVAAGSIRNRLIAAKSMSDLGSPIVTQVLMEHYLTSSNLTSRIETITSALKRKRDIALSALSSMAPDGVRWERPVGGFNIWITLPHHVNTDELLVRAIGHGVSYLPGSACYSDGVLHHQLRLSYSYLSDTELQEGISRLCETLREALNATPQSHTPMI